MPRKKTPGYWHHRPSGQAYVRIDGKDHYLGQYDSAESRDRYEDLIREWQRSQNADRYSLRIDELALKYLDYAKTHYRKNGSETSEVSAVRGCLRILVAVAGNLRARDFGPLKLQAVRNEMIAQGWKRKSINKQVGRLRRCFRWAVQQELIAGEILIALGTVPGLQQGRSDAVESVPVKPVSEAAIEAIRPFVSRQVWAMVQLQRVTAMRPGEVTAIRGCDITMGGTLWEYTPESHKTEHHGKERIIVLGPQAQNIIRPFLKADLSEFLFSPADSLAELNELRRANRTTPMTPSQKLRQKIANPERSPGDRYTPGSYRKAICKGCEKAFGMPRELRNVSTTLPAAEREQLKALARAWRETHCWHPHQLRHTAATQIRREFGLEASQVTLGHASADVTQIYAERDLELARKVASQLG